ncbi:hypothetical protein GQ651_14985 [Alphaproteobacteria bacterium GH1-50]|uniref:Uncharacterized protein n=1 Tax=Kangsaoukella pontilimi TaxID=2691042 RepID=A0A7C9IQH0_9RHOB|nr:hypothetical protein [Kangsaoukella pontilimi]MXQ09150.1 hypothetical protein [Kangsaoukella pontilimi]
MKLPPVTFLVGPYTRATLALNAAVRDRRAHMAEAGLTAFPSRTASPVARALALGEGSLAEREAAFDAAVGLDADGGGPVLLSSLNALGAPVQAISGRDLFPEMGAFFAGLARTRYAGARIVVGVEPLTLFFASAGTEALAKRVSNTPWEVLYELSWAELLRDIRALCPEAELLVVTPEASVARAGEVLDTIFGPAAAATHARGLQNAHLSVEGQAVLQTFDAAGAGENVLTDILSRLGSGPSDDELEARFGIDRLTATLLDQRFAEDVAALSRMDGVHLL